MKSKTKIAALQKPTGCTIREASTCCGARTVIRTRKGQPTHVCKACHYVTTAKQLITSAQLQPLDSRRPVAVNDVLDILYRGFNYQLPSGKQVSIRDMAEGATLHILYGKRLQRTLIHRIKKSTNPLHYNPICSPAKTHIKLDHLTDTYYA